MTEYPGSPMKWTERRDETLNKNSSLRRKWYVLKDPSAPAFLDGPAGISISFAMKYWIDVAPTVKTLSEPLSAVEIRVVVLDVFGNFQRTLSGVEVEDIPADSTWTCNLPWPVYSESLAGNSFASIAYVAKARTQEGRVYEANPALVLDQIRRVARQITETDLDPKRVEQGK